LQSKPQKAARPLKAGLSIVKLQALCPDLPMACLEASLEHWQRAETLVVNVEAVE
jgi:hypothetical protein